MDGPTGTAHAPRLDRTSIAVALIAFTLSSFPLAAAGPSQWRTPARTKGTSGSATLVINEIDVDQPGTDTAEFIELRNVGASPLNLVGHAIELVNGDGGGAAIYRTIPLPDWTLAAGDWYVVCGNAQNVPNCDLDLGISSNLIQNGAPDAVAVTDGTIVLDTVSYEGDTGAPYTEDSGIGLVDDGSATAVSLSRYPDGTDTDRNNEDLSPRCASPGQANVLADTGCGDPTPTPSATPPAPETPTAAPTPSASAPPPTLTAMPAPGAATATPTPDYLAVSVEAFWALRSNKDVYVLWRTVWEIDNAGFRVWRESASGSRTCLTDATMPPRGSPLRGATYRFHDADAPLDPTRYWIEDVDIRGTRAWHGPLQVPACGLARPRRTDR